MPRIPRRAALLGLMAAVAGAAGAWAGGTRREAQFLGTALNWKPTQAIEAASEEPIPGGGQWKVDGVVTHASSDSILHITGYASAASVNLGEDIDFHVSVAKPGDYWVEVYRMGFYGGQGGRRLAVSPRLSGITQVVPKKTGEMGTVSCDWPSAWRLPVPRHWVSGYYLAVFTTADGGYRSYTPFVVRDDEREADLCVIVPTTTYQAYNLWPKNGKTGKSLYYGYKKALPSPTPSPLRGNAKLDYALRAREVSFDRPYANAGLPANCDLDLTFISWAEQAGYDMVYATSQDLHSGKVNAARFRGLVFSGHDEYWSREMRDNAAVAAAGGTSLVFLSANNVYWRIRMPQTADGRTDRLVTCYKDEGHEQVSQVERTIRWREETGPREPEQHLLGVQFNGILDSPVPLVVREKDHWFWAGTGVADGDHIPDVVGAEADGHFGDISVWTAGRQTLLSSSPYITTGGGAQVQNTSLIETASGGIVFVAASLTWPRSLGPEGDPRIQQATANLLDRVVRRKSGTIS